MRIATISHSHVAPRQQLFFKEVARQGHDVLMISPGQWHDYRVRDYLAQYDKGCLVFRTCRHIGQDAIYTYELLGIKEIVDDFKPDWLYIQAEAGAVQTAKALELRKCRKALFVWENIKIPTMGIPHLEQCDLVVCGNKEAENLVKPYNANTALMLQVGIDTDHFAARPGVKRDIGVAYIGRRTPEKGLPYLLQAYPTACILDYIDFIDLPWKYSQVQVLVAYSQDIPQWNEQAPNYVVLEGLACGCKAVTSDTAAMKFWLQGAPGIVMVEGHLQYDPTIKLGRVIALNKGINKALDMKIGDEGRQWVMDNFSNPVLAKKLVETLGC